MRLDALPDYVSRVGALRDVNAEFLHLPEADYATWLCAEAVDSGHAVKTDTHIRACTAPI
jgi:hypothetical protein